jgi:uncharacterized beta-barrel protein YwiB (DUF1934 family)
MLAKVNIRIRSSIANEGESAPELADEAHEGYIKYDESALLLLSYKVKTEGGSVTTELIPEDGAIRLVRRGAIASDLTFREGTSHKSLYTVAPYSFDMSVHTDSLAVRLDTDGGEVRISYRMEIGGAEKTCLMHLSYSRI